MNYITSDAMPSAFITKRKSRLKVYQSNNVHLNDGDNFEIEIYNPTTAPILAKIKLNGSYISSNGVVIKPGQRVFLERFLDSNNKFVFNTYEVDNNRENKDAIAFNGDVTIEFYNKTQPNHYTYGTILTNTYGSTSTGPSNYNTFTTTSSLSNSAMPISGSISYSNTSQSLNLTAKYNSKNIETGMVEKGETSNQTFTSSYDNFEYFSFKKVEYKILPSGVKAVYSSDLKQYCTDCGKKVKKNHKFCPACGTKI
jgi:hypothetical protein